MTAFIKAMHDLAARQAGRNGPSKVLLSEELFDPADLVALRAVIDPHRVEILPAREIRARATQRLADGRQVTRHNLGCVVGRRELLSLWEGSHMNNNNATVIALDDDLRDERYLYLEALIGFVHAAMAGDTTLLRSYHEIIFDDEQPLDERLLSALIADNPNPIAFTRAILKFKPAEPFDPQLIDAYKRAMETLLCAA